MILPACCARAVSGHASAEQCEELAAPNHSITSSASSGVTLLETEAFERSRRDRKRVEMLFAHLKRVLRLGRLRLRGPRGAQFEFTLAAIAQNLPRLAKLVARPPPFAAPGVA
jgi:Transposase DDE domain